MPSGIWVLANIAGDEASRMNAPRQTTIGRSLFSLDFMVGKTAQKLFELGYYIVMCNITYAIPD